ncbi:hypothetical protein Ait01nite_047120 [Actinoplanes italicus]|nr:hypothetical protein Ait01nite_047120 [Actinoplanes italicus]
MGLGEGAADRPDGQMWTATRRDDDADIRLCRHVDSLTQGRRSGKQARPGVIDSTLGVAGGAQVNAGRRTGAAQTSKCVRADPGCGWHLQSTHDLGFQ